MTRDSDAVGGCRTEVLGRLPAGVRAADIRRTLAAAGRALGLGRAVVSVRFAGDRTLRRYNRRFRGVDRPTDVLSFACGDDVAGCRLLGDLLLSRDRVLVQARRNRLTPRREVDELVLHGLLHLIGYDHESDSGEMDALEIELRASVLDRPRRLRVA